MEWSGAELNFNNTQYMYTQEINVYLFLKYTKNMVTSGLNRKYIIQVNEKLLCYKCIYRMNRTQNPDFDLSTQFFLNLGQARKYCLVSKWPGNLVLIIE